MRIVVLGASGFIGSHVVAHGRLAGFDVTGVRAPRIAGVPAGPTRDAAASWRRDNAAAFERLCEGLTSTDVVINAAGVATPGGTDRTTLFAANAVMPAVLGLAAGAAGVRRLVHVSTSAVQGRLDPLDETPRHFPLSPYAAAKAEAERVLLAGTTTRGEVPPEVVVYRPTSVHGLERGVTRDLARLASRLPFLAVAGGGDRPTPVTLIDNVAAGVVFAATTPEPAPVVLQPSEGVTTRALLDLFGAPWVLSLPERPAGVALAAAARGASWSPGLTARLRRVELVVRGQGVEARALASADFVAPLGPEGWVALAQAELAAVARNGNARAGRWVGTRR